MQTLRSFIYQRYLHNNSTRLITTKAKVIINLVDRCNLITAKEDKQIKLNSANPSLTVNNQVSKKRAKGGRNLNAEKGNGLTLLSSLIVRKYREKFKGY